MTGNDFEAIIIDYNGVIGWQASRRQWRELASLAGWPAERLNSFQRAFWSARPAYDTGLTTDQQYWHGLLRRSDQLDDDLLAALVKTEVAMWMGTDARVLDLLRVAQANGIRNVLLSNAPRAVANAIDATEWCRTLMSSALYSARLGANKPDPATYRAALAAAGNPDPSRTLFVDDRLDNIRAAALGLRTVHYTGYPATLARHVPTAPRLSGRTPATAP